jgi:hypothetical protein
MSTVARSSERGYTLYLGTEMVMEQKSHTIIRPITTMASDTTVGCSRTVGRNEDH